MCGGCGEEKVWEGVDNVEKECVSGRYIFVGIHRGQIILGEKGEREKRKKKT